MISKELEFPPFNQEQLARIEHAVEAVSPSDDPADDVPTKQFVEEVAAHAGATLRTHDWSMQMPEFFRKIEEGGASLIADMRKLADRMDAERGTLGAFSDDDLVTARVNRTVADLRSLADQAARTWTGSRRRGPNMASMTRDTFFDSLVAHWEASGREVSNYKELREFLAACAEPLCPITKWTVNYDVLVGYLQKIAARKIGAV